MRRRYALLFLPFAVACAGHDSPAPSEASPKDAGDHTGLPSASEVALVDKDAVEPPASLEEVDVATDFDFRGTHPVRLRVMTQVSTPLIVRLGGRVVFRGQIAPGGQVLSWAVPRYADALDLEWRRGGHSFDRHVALPMPAADVVTLEEVL